MEELAPVENDWVPYPDVGPEKPTGMPEKVIVKPRIVWVMLGSSLLLGLLLGHYLPGHSTVPSPSSQVVGVTPAATNAAHIVVDVHGDVWHPGTYTLERSARVQDAVTAAGGYLHAEDGTAVNSAAPLDDGAEIVIPNVRADQAKQDMTTPSPSKSRLVPTPNMSGASGTGTAAGQLSGVASRPSAGPASLIDLNSADARTLQTLPGIGPTRAQDIVTYRQVHGVFHNVDDLKNVRGIGPTLFSRIAPFVRVFHP